MTDHIKNALKAEFPDLFHPGEPRDIECGDGWAGILRGLFNVAMEERKATGEDIRLSLAKEKFGFLCVYWYNATQKLHDATDTAAKASKATCESCGSVEGVTMNTRGWIRALCGPCREAR